MQNNIKSGEKLVIGLDVGTTGAKAIVTDASGTVYGRGYREYGLYVSADGERVEQNAADWFDSSAAAVRTACEGIDIHRVAALSMSTQGASMLAVDKDFRALTPVITWMDKRSVAEVAALDKNVGREKLYLTTGWNLGTAYDLPKILWLKKHMPEVFAEAFSFVSTLEYMNYRLTGKNVTDPTNTAIRMLMDIKTRRYDKDILNAVELDEERIPEIMPTGSSVGKLSPSSAAAFGLSADTSVYNGAHDQYCSSLGAGAVRVSDMLVATGTTWVVLGIGDKPVFTESGIAPGVHPVDGLYGAMASLISAGSALKWYKSIIGEDYPEIDKNAASRRDSAKDILFKPYLAGAGFPHGGERLSAGIDGLTIRHDRYDIAYALMEGVAFEVKTVLEEFGRAGCSAATLMMTGRTAHSALWRSIVRDVTGCEISVTEEPDTGCMGAAVIAAAGCGLYGSLAEASLGMVRSLLRDIPEPENVEFYKEKYSRYREYTKR